MHLGCVIIPYCFNLEQFNKLEINKFILYKVS